jgi:hypothetical protein
MINRNVKIVMHADGIQYSICFHRKKSIPKAPFYLVNCLHKPYLGHA